jgi:hypothetical protein
LQQQRPQQLLGRYRGTTRRRVQLIELLRQFGQGLIHHLAYPPQRVTGRHPLFQTDIAENPILLLIVSAHACFLPYFPVQGI